MARQHWRLPDNSKEQLTLELAGRSQQNTRRLNIMLRILLTLAGLGLAKSEVRFGGHVVTGDQTGTVVCLR